MAKKKISFGSLETEVEVIKQDLRSEQELDDEAESWVRFLGSKLSEDLREVIMEMMLGFTKKMQMEMADDLLEFAYGHVVHTTGCCSADAVLLSCYKWIAEEQGFRFVIK